MDKERTETNNSEGKNGKQKRDHKRAEDTFKSFLISKTVEVKKN